MIRLRIGVPPTDEELEGIRNILSELTDLKRGPSATCRYLMKMKAARIRCFSEAEWDKLKGRAGV